MTVHSVFVKLENMSNSDELQENTRGAREIDFEAHLATEQTAHPILETVIKRIQTEVFRLRLESESADPESRADIFDRVLQLEADRGFLEQVATQYRGWGRMNDLSHALIYKGKIDELLTRYEDLGTLAWGYETVYLHGQLSAPELQGKGIVTEKPSFKTRQEFDAMSPTLQNKYEPMQVLRSITIPVSTDALEPVLDRVA